MKKFMLRRLGVAHDPGSFKPSLQDCIEAVLEQSDTLVDDVLTGLKGVDLCGSQQIHAGHPEPCRQGRH
jgi:hypothetical protein